MVVDSRGLNPVTVNDSYSMENNPNILDSVHGSKKFTKIDLFSGYRDILITEEGRHKTAFVVPAAAGVLGGLFHSNRMCFGLTNAPATFC